MALTYEQSSELMGDMVFRGRVKVACLTYANYIYGEPATTPGHSSRIKWSQMTMTSPEAAAAQVTPTVVMDPSIQQDGSAVTDAGLQSAVENSINKML